VNSDPSNRQPARSAGRPGRFCTRCGTFNLSDHRFCDHCGLPLAQSKVAVASATSDRGRAPTKDPDSPVQPEPTSAHRPKHLRWLAPGAALSCVLVAALAGIIWHAAAPPPSSEEVLAALHTVGAQIIKPSADLLCLNNLPYHRHHIQVQPSDAATRGWLDGLVQAGLYAPGVEVVPDEVTGSTLVQYQTLPALNQWRRDGRLCVAQDWVVESVPSQTVRKDTDAHDRRYIASVSWRAQNVAPWVAHLPLLGLRLNGVNMDAKGLTTTTQQIVERKSGNWAPVVSQ
jgi:hypothetical protein